MSVLFVGLGCTSSESNAQRREALAKYLENEHHISAACAHSAVSKFTDDEVGQILQVYRDVESTHGATVESGFPASKLLDALASCN